MFLREIVRRNKGPTHSREELQNLSKLGEEESMINESYYETEDCPEEHLADHFELNPRIRLPMSDNEWLLANNFFSRHL